MSKDYYAILGVPRNATQAQVRTRFRELARSQHPDRYSGEEKAKAEDEFQEITHAFNVLNDPERRREIDATLVQREKSAGDDKGDAAKVYLRRGVKAYKEANYSEAADNFERATREEPRDARAWVYLAQACQHQRRWWPKARKAAAKACEIEPMNAKYLKLAGRLFAESEMFARAEKYYIAAQSWGGEDADVEAALVEIRRRMKKPRGGLFGG